MQKLPATDGPYWVGSSTLPISPVSVSVSVSVSVRDAGETCGIFQYVKLVRPEEHRDVRRVVE